MVLLVVVLLNLPTQTVTKLKLAVSGLFLPLFGLAASSREATTRAGDALLSKRDLLREIKELGASNQVLNLQLLQTAEVWRENGRLSQMLNTARQRPWKLRMARVIAREPTTWWRSVWIDLGSRDGMRTNLAVLTPDCFLVGKVQTVGETRSQILLLGDPGLRVSVLAGTNNESGVVISISTSPRGNNLMDLAYLSAASRIHPGDKAITSGVGGVFPGGIPVGQVVDLQPQDNGLSMAARVRLFADLTALEEVWVILP